MSKRNKIRWSEEDYKEIANVVRIFNSKITRTLKKNPEFESYMPNRANTQDIKDKIETRADLNRLLKSLRRFSKKNAETPVLTDKGVYTTKWEIKEYSYKVAAINRARTIEAKKANVTTEKGTMGTIEANNLKPKSFHINNMSAKDWEKFKLTVDKQVMDNYHDKRKETYKANYLKNILYNLDPNDEKVQKLYKLIESTSADVLYKAYYDDPVLQINYTSDPLPSAFIARTSLSRWKKYLGIEDNGEDDEDQFTEDYYNEFKL